MINTNAEFTLHSFMAAFSREQATPGMASIRAGALISTGHRLVNAGRRRNADCGIEIVIPAEAGIQKSLDSGSGPE